VFNEAYFLAIFSVVVRTEAASDWKLRLTPHTALSIVLEIRFSNVMFRNGSGI
jgi:hypothetical protein